MRRKVTPYEAVTGKFHYHFRRDPAPFELDPQLPLNVWYLRYREGSPFQVQDREGYRDPARLTYRDYITLQHERELYVGQMAPSSYLTNPAHFQAADEMRRIRRIAYWTQVLANAHDPALARTDTARDRWVAAAAGQPLRRAVERLMIAYDWDEAFTALNLVVKPSVDALLGHQFADLAKRNDDLFFARLFTEFTRDARRSQQCSAALCATPLIAIRPWPPSCPAGSTPGRHPPRKAVAALADQYAIAPVPLTGAATAVQAQVAALHTACGPTGVPDVQEMPEVPASGQVASDLRAAGCSLVQPFQRSTRIQITVPVGGRCR